MIFESEKERETFFSSIGYLRGLAEGMLLVDGNDIINESISEKIHSKVNSLERLITENTHKTLESKL